MSAAPDYQPRSGSPPTPARIAPDRPGREAARGVARARNCRVRPPAASFSAMRPATLILILVGCTYDLPMSVDDQSSGGPMERSSAPCQRTAKTVQVAGRGRPRRRRRRHHHLGLTRRHRRHRHRPQTRTPSRPRRIAPRRSITRRASHAVNGTSTRCGASVAAGSRSETRRRAHGAGQMSNRGGPTASGRALLHRSLR